MVNQPQYLTREGLEGLEKKLHFLKTIRRPEVAERLHQIMTEGGELGESAEYDDVKKEQAFVEAEIARLTHIINNARIIEDEDLPNDVVQIGSRVLVIEEGYGEEEFFQLVGSAEANPSQGKVSIESPVGRALMGARVGDKVVVKTPDGHLVYKVKRID